jgi:hypothetical protein
MISTADLVPVLNAVLTSGVKITTQIQHHKAALTGRTGATDMRRGMNGP